MSAASPVRSVKRMRCAQWIRLRNVKGHSGWPCEQVCDTCLVAGGGSEGDELLVGVIGDLEHDVVQVELAESRVT